MTNTNCLEGVKCPKCGQEDRFLIEAKIMVTVTDDGTENDDGQYDWEDDSACVCPECDHTGKLGEFYGRPPVQTEPPEKALLDALKAALDIVASDYTIDAYEYDPADIRSQVQQQIEAAIAKASGK